MRIVDVFSGILLLIFGRKLFWLFVGIIGYTAGVLLATQLLPAADPWLVLVAGLVTGMIMAFLAVTIYHFALGLAGFLSGGLFSLRFLAMVEISSPSPYFDWILFLLGGIIGTALLLWLFDWALIALSSLGGASLISASFPFQPFNELILFFVLFGLGIAIQVSIKQQENDPDG